MTDYEKRCNDDDDRGDWEYEQEKQRRLDQEMEWADLEASRIELKSVFLEKTP